MAVPYHPNKPTSGHTQLDINNFNSLEKTSSWLNILQASVWAWNSWQIYDILWSSSQYSSSHGLRDKTNSPKILEGCFLHGLIVALLKKGWLVQETHLRTPRKVDSRSLRALRCKAGSSAQRAACWEAVTPREEASDDLEPSTCRIRIARASNGLKGAGTFIQSRKKNQVQQNTVINIALHYIQAVNAVIS